MNKLAVILAAAIIGSPVALPAAHAQASQPAQAAIAGQGKVNAIDAKASKVNLTHGPIQALQWPAMTMDFAVLPGVDLSGLKVGDDVTFTLGRAPDGMYAIDKIMLRK